MTQTIDLIGHIMGIKTVREYESAAIIDHLKRMGIEALQRDPYFRQSATRSAKRATAVYKRARPPTSPPK